MSVIVSYQSKTYIFTKGSPEIMKGICMEMDDGFESQLEENVKMGYRVLAMGCR
jgi:magnesium-transporting ATPase (P-type)